MDNNVLEYYTSEQISELLKEYMTETQYFSFLKSCVKFDSKMSLEQQMIQLMDKKDLFEKLKDFNEDIYNKLKNEMFNNIY